jgi:hypothetical protein
MCPRLCGGLGRDIAQFDDCNITSVALELDHNVDSIQSITRRLCSPQGQVRRR